MTRRRWISSAAVVGLSACVLAGSVMAGGAAAAPSGEPGAQLDLWMRSGKEPQGDTIVKAYNDAHSDQITVTYVPADQFLTKLSTAVASGAAPDLVATDLIFMPQLVQGGVLADISDTIGSLPYAATLAPAHMTNSTSADGRVYGVPMILDASVYFYNKSLFDQAGLDPASPPTTWAQLSDAAKAVSALGGETKGYWFGGNFPGGLAYNFTPLVWAQGGEIENADGSFRFDTPEMITAMQLLRDLWVSGTMPESVKSEDGTNFFAAFQTGDIGIAAVGTDGSVPYSGSALGFDMGAFPIPGPTGGQATFTGGDVLSIPASQDGPSQAALDFVTWLTSDETQASVYLGNSYIPVRSDLVEQLPADANPYLRLGASLVGDGRTFHSPHYNEVVASPTGPYLKLYRSVVFDGVDPAVAVQTAQAEADAITNR